MRLCRRNVLKQKPTQSNVFIWQLTRWIHLAAQERTQTLHSLLCVPYDTRLLLYNRHELSAYIARVSIVIPLEQWLHIPPLAQLRISHVCHSIPISNEKFQFTLANICFTSFYSKAIAQYFAVTNDFSLRPQTQRGSAKRWN